MLRARRPRRYTAEAALQALQDIPSDQSETESNDGEFDDNENTDPTSVEDSSSSSDSEEDILPLNQRILNSEEVISGVCSPQSQDTCKSANTTKGRDGTTWRLLVAQKYVTAGRLPIQNVLRKKPGPTAYAQTKVNKHSPLSSFRVFFDEPMIRHIQKCTVSEARRTTGSDTWNISLGELEQFVGLIIARGVIGARNAPVRNMWSKAWDNQIFPQTMTRDRFSDILRFLRFHIKSERKDRLQTDKFALASEIWNRFIANCNMAYNPYGYLTADEQLLPCKARCRFIQYMANKPDKFGLKFWLLVDTETKYLCNGYPYLGKDESQDASGSQPTGVVMKL